MIKEKDPNAQAMGKKSWEKRQLTQDSEYFRELAKKSHAKRKKNKKISTRLKKKGIVK